MSDKRPTQRLTIVQEGAEPSDWDVADETEPGRPQRVSVLQMYRAIKELRDDIARLTQAVDDIAGLARAACGLLRFFRWCAISAGAMALVAAFIWWIK